MDTSSLGSIAEEDEEEYVGDLSDDVAEACGEIDKMLDDALCDKPSEVKCLEMEIITKPGHLYPSLVRSY